MGRIDFFLGVFLLIFPAPTAGFLLSSVLQLVSLDLAGSVSSDDGNQKILNATVFLCDAAGTRLEETATDEFGAFSFRGLGPGRYVLRVSASSFEPGEVRIDLSFASERALSVSLKPLRSAAVVSPGHQIISARELTIPQSARALFASGKTKLYRDKDPQSALRDFQAATAQFSGYYEAYYQSGMAYLALQNSAAAEQQFRKSVELSQKQFADADIALGTILRHGNQIAEGESLLRQGLALNPKSWTGQFELGELEFSRGHLDLALSAAEAAAELAPRQPVVYRLLAVIELQQKNYPAVLAALRSYIQLDPDSPAGQRAKELLMQTTRELQDRSEAAVAVK